MITETFINILMLAAMEHNLCRLEAELDEAACCMDSQDSYDKVMLEYSDAYESYHTLLNLVEWTDYD